MKHFAIYFFIAGLFSSCYLKPIRSVKSLPLVNDKRHLFLQCSINDKPALFLLDTGSGISIIDFNQIEKYNLTIKPGWGSGVITGLGTLENVQYLSNVKFKISGTGYKPVFYSADLANVNQSFASRNIKISGILGGDFFKQYQATINYKQSLITF